MLDREGEEFVVVDSAVVGLGVSPTCRRIRHALVHTPKDRVHDLWSQVETEGFEAFPELGAVEGLIAVRIEAVEKVVEVHAARRRHGVRYHGGRATKRRSRQSESISEEQQRRWAWQRKQYRFETALQQAMMGDVASSWASLWCSGAVWGFLVGLLWISPGLCGTRKGSPRLSG